DELVNTTDLDCNDADPAINPAATEICDGIDNDCDGLIDSEDADFEDNTPPVALCQDVTVQLDASGTGSTTASAVDNGSGDACGIQSTVLNSQSFSCAEIGANTVTLTVTDLHGNESTCTATVTVEDNIAPTALCQDLTVQLDEDGQGEITTQQVDNGSSDLCGVPDLDLDQTKFDCDDIGSISVTLTVTDGSNHASTCTAVITVEDHIAPTVLCRDATVQLDENGLADIPVGDIDGGSTDACGTQSAVLSSQSFSCADIGVNTVTLTVTDVNGNAATCSASVTVEDNVNPTALCRNATVQLDGNGLAVVLTGDIDNGSDDACGIQSAVLSSQSFGCGDMGANTVTLTVTDANGNSAACTATVMVEDITDPLIDCNDITVTFNGAASIDLNPEEMAFATDNCTIQGLTAGQVAVTCDAIGEVIPVTVTAVDPSGNTAGCISYVAVEGLPCGWMTVPDGIGCSGGSEGSYDADTESFTLGSDGCDNPTSAGSDESGYIKYELCGDGSITAHIAGLTTPGFAGIVMRESAEPGAKKVAIAYNGSSALARYVRYTTGGMSYPSYIQAFGARWMRIVRTGNTFKGYYSVNGTSWVYAFAVSVAMDDCIQVGLMAWSVVSNQLVTANFDHVAVDTPYGTSLSKGNDTDIPAELTTETPSAALWPNPSSGVFNLVLDPAWGEDVKIEILDGVGRSIALRLVDTSDENQVRFNLEDQPPGIYLVRIEGQNGLLAARRMVIAR
ncbi:MAG: HYR domain-containing protein, partial [Lewinella sp.]|nr:HYR domain-containing protein [Lewinella sp.]